MALRPTTFLTLEQIKTWCKVTPGQSKSVESLSAAAGTATATVPNHGFANGDTVVIAGATPTDYNGSHAIAGVDADTFTFAVTGAPAAAEGANITAQSNQDALLTLIADWVCAAIESDTARVFIQRAFDETRDGDGTRSLILAGYPATVSSLTIDDSEIDAADYVVSPFGVVRLKSRVFPERLGNVVVAGTCGYSAEHVPADVIGVALELVKFFFDRHSANALNASAISIGPASVTIVPGVPKDLRDRVAQLRDQRTV